MGQDVVKVIRSHETIVVKIGLDENLLDFLVIQIFTKILSNLLELVGGDFSLNKFKITALLMSKETQTLSTSALLSLSLSLAVASLKNSGKSIPPD